MSVLHRRRSLAAIVLIPLCFLAACGTRVPLSDQQVAAQSSGGDGLGLGAPTDPGITAPSSTAPTTSGQSNDPVAEASSNSSETPSDLAPTESAPTGGSGSGKSTQPVRVGFVISKVNATSFVPGLSTGDQEQQSKIVVSNINATGGLNGRPIAPVFYGVQATAPATWGQDACASLVQDNHVTFVISNVGDPQGLLAPCLAKAGVTLINDDYQVDSVVAKSIAGHIFLPGGWVEDRLMRTLIAGLAGQGFLKSTDKVGVLLYDEPISQRVLKNVVLPALAGLGLKDVQTSASASSAALNQSGPALKFKAAGVTRVLSIEDSPLFFMEAAQQQGYHPRYALYSNYGPAVLLQSAAPKQQLEGSAGIGYSPVYDVDSAHSPGPVSANETRCLKIMKAGGVDTSQATVRALILWICDAGWFLQAAVKKSGAVSAAGLAAGAKALTTYQSPVTFRSDLTSGRPDGASVYRDLAYDSGCSCFKYTSGLKPAVN